MIYETIVECTVRTKPMDGVYGGTICILPVGARVDIVETRETAIGPHGKLLFGRIDAGAGIVALAKAGPGWIEMKQVKPVPVEPPPAPTITFTATPATIQAGESSTLNWEAVGVEAVTLTGGGMVDQGVAGDGPLSQMDVRPSATTTYTLKVTPRGGLPVISRSVTVTVTPVQPPPQPTKRLTVSINVIGDREMAHAIAQSGAACLSVSFNPGLAREVAATYPNTFVMVRPALRSGDGPWYMPGSAVWADNIEMNSFANMKNVGLLGTNENDNNFPAIRDRVYFDLDNCRRARAIGVRYIHGGWPFGNWDQTSFSTVKDFVDLYGQVMREEIAETGACWFNIHMYTGRDGSKVGLWDRFVREYDIQYPTHDQANAWPANWDLIQMRALQVVWTSQRFRLMVPIIQEYCGIDATKVVFVSDEASIEGDVEMPPAVLSGGFRQNGFTMADVIRYYDELARVSALPTVYTYKGVTKSVSSTYRYALAFVGNGGARWAGYEMRDYWPGMAASGRAWWKG